MKKFLILLLLVVLVVLDHKYPARLQGGQLGWQKIKYPVSDGYVVRGWARRDLSLYPLTPLGNQRFLSDVNTDQIPIVYSDPTRANN